MITMPVASWTAFKALIASKALKHQHHETATTYELFALEEIFVWAMGMPKNGGADQLDFEANFKASSNARLATALKPFADADGFRARFKGIIGTALAGVVTNVDHVLAEERWIDGVEISHVGGAKGDTVNFQIVHPTAGVVDEFGASWNIDSTTGKQGAVILNYPAKIAAGLTIRCAYASVGTVNVWVGVNLRLHKKT